VRAASRRRLHNPPGGGGRPARGPSATEIAKTYYTSRPSAPRPLRDMCANEKERGRTAARDRQSRLTTSTAAAMATEAVDDGRWFVAYNIVVICII